MRASRGLSFIASAVIGLGVMTGLVACTPEPPEPTPTASSSGPASPTPTPTTPPEAVAPEPPAAMAEISVAGAEAAATYFLQLYPYVYATQDLEPWRVMSRPECEFCASVISNVETQIAAGNTSSGGLVTIDETVEATELSPELFRVTMTISQEPGSERAPDGTVVEESDGGRYLMSVGLVPADAGWTISGVAFEDAPTP